MVKRAKDPHTPKIGLHGPYTSHRGTREPVHDCLDRNKLRFAVYGRLPLFFPTLGFPNSSFHSPISFLPMLSLKPYKHLILDFSTSTFLNLDKLIMKKNQDQTLDTLISNLYVSKLIDRKSVV